MCTAVCIVYEACSHNILQIKSRCIDSIQTNDAGKSCEAVILGPILQRGLCVVCFEQARKGINQREVAIVTSGYQLLLPMTGTKDVKEILKKLHLEVEEGRETEMMWRVDYFETVEDKNTAMGELKQVPDGGKLEDKETKDEDSDEQVFNSDGSSATGSGWTERPAEVAEKGEGMGSKNSLEYTPSPQFLAFLEARERWGSFRRQ